MQYEQIGKIDDTLWLSSIKINRNYCRNREFLNTLRKYHKIFVDVDDDEAVAKKVIEIAESKTAEYVYLKHNITQDDRKRIKIRSNISKVIKLIGFYCMIKQRANMEQIKNELFIISCLQAILLDKKDEFFNYTFYDYESFSNKKIRVQAALKKDTYICHALQTYWVHKVENHFHANIEAFCSTEDILKIEIICDKITKKILEYPNIYEMNKVNDLTLGRIYELFVNQKIIKFE